MAQPKSLDRDNPRGIGNSSQIVQHRVLSDQVKQAIVVHRSDALMDAPVDVRIHGSLEEIEAEFRLFEKTADRTVFQSFDWLAKWQRHIGTEIGTVPILAVGRDPRGEILFIFPLAVETRSTVRRLRWLASDLCDYNAPLLAPHFSDYVTRTRFLAIWRDLLARLAADHRLRFDLVDLPKMPQHVGAQANPFLYLEHRPNPSGAYVATLGTDWESYYALKRSSNTRRKERRQLRHLAEFGELKFHHEIESQEAERTIEVLYQQKSHILSRMGAEDIFARPGYRAFFRDIVTDPAVRSLAHITRFDVGPVIGAVNLILTFRDRSYLVLSSYYDGEFTRHGPGRALLYDLLREAMIKGFRYFDFTIGDEGYKRDWSDINLVLYDHLAAGSLRGRAVLAGTLAFRSTKRLIKQTPVLWRAFNRLRAMAGRSAPAREKSAEAEREE